ncbi:uncharacterized protein LOC143152756 isoform X3 [Ptiloglossa arizonensis]|uniref:uncharacterized protein LOC143152756 isoform X3 n=1 Tax=Ptiloglossa arizonensis TaxID=3350558 RepID=UPI003F9EEE12
MADSMCLLLAMFGQLFVRGVEGSLVGAELDETSQEFLNEYSSLDEGKHFTELQRFQDTTIEIDLIDQKKKYRPIHRAPRVLYQIGASEEELPECSDRSQVCSKVDLYGLPWVERQCRCPDGRICPGSLHGDDGHTIVDKTRQYKLCEPVKRLPICRYFKDVTWTLAPGGGPANATIQRVYCRCRPASVPYLVRRQAFRYPEGNPGFIYAFACSPQSTGVRLPEGASAALAKPTKYHYYPHNQHIYLLPECAVQQVCNAVYVRLNFTQPLCACPGRYRDPCSASLDSDDLHTTELVTDPRTKALTLVKTCEPVAEMRECRTPRDWSLLALQNVRTGKSHYLVICRCPDANILEGPMSHDQPTYASVPGIRVYGMMCVQGNRRGRPLRYTRSLFDSPNEETVQDSVYIEKEDRLTFPWYKVQQLMNAAVWD